MQCFDFIRSLPLGVRLTRKDRRWRSPYYLKHLVTRWLIDRSLEYAGTGSVPEEAFRVAAVAAGMKRKGDTFLVVGDSWLLDAGEVGR